MKKSVILLFVLCLLTTPLLLLGQTTVDEMFGDERYSYYNWHSGNMIRTSFYNEGYVGQREGINPGTLGEWPINSGHNYINLITYMMLSEVKDTDGIIRHISSEANGVTTGDDGNAASADSRDDGTWQCNAPLPGFANPEVQRIAMSHQPQTWPNLWPDKFEDTVDPGWGGVWNGYFGKDVLNADQESYYVFDDYQNDEFSFYPDSTDSLRRGLGLRGTTRGFQWSNVLVEDNLFQLLDIKNIGTYDHSKMIFGIMSGPVIGRSVTGGGDGSDDAARFDLARRIGWHFDEDDMGAGGWTPVGAHGFAYYESPGNPYDGIDNDDDANLGEGPVITEETFAPKVINAGDPIILIDYTTFERTITTMPEDGITITYLGNQYHYDAGAVYEEIQANLIDDNFNGIIDESNGYEFGSGDTAIRNFLYVGRKYIDYYTGEGQNNPMLEERRDDGIDNDGDWNVLTDDVGMDGVPNTGDLGEGDGLPTSGRGTDLPGEPHIDKTDIDESDMIGLTAFYIFVWGNPKISDDEGLWQGFTPGYLNDYAQFSDTDLMLGSGYFPLASGDTERFSLGILFGDSFEDMFTNSDYAKKTYEENYNFAKAPIVPELEVIPGDNRVTLIWDDAAEFSVDPISGLDFEGYRIYRSTDPAWNDHLPITDGQGSVAYRKPLVQFDLNNGLTGYHPIHIRGVEFYLGDDTGIVNTFVDSTAKNGQTYYYAVTSFDHGDDVLGISPSECSKYISIGRDGKIEKGRNVAIAKPEAPVLGFTEATISQITPGEGSTASGAVGFEVVNPTVLQDDVKYKVVFEDTIVTNDAGRLVMGTKNFSLINTSTSEVLIDKSTALAREDIQPVTDGFMLKLINADGLAMRADSSGWVNDVDDSLIYMPDFQPYRYSRTNGVGMAHDYLVEFGEMGFGTSSELVVSATRILPEMPVNFKITNTLTGEPVQFGFYERDLVAGEEGKLTAFTDRTRTDEVIFLEPNEQDSLIITWHLTFATPADGLDSLYRNPVAGDKFVFKTSKPFLSNDVYEFTTSARKVDDELAKAQMDMIRVVPNPYVVANSWEPLNPYTSGRGPREIHFTHLPQECTIRIFNIRGQLVREIEHVAAESSDGTYVWDMLTKDNLDISYGVYIYHVDAGEIGEKIGKFAIIK